jgi:hypothetical protein
VYLDATEAVSAGLIAVGKFSNLEIPHDKLTEEYLAKASSIYKIHIIAKEETVRATSHYSSELGATFLRLTPKRLALLTQSQKITTLRSLVESFVKEQSRILDLMNQHNLGGSRDQRAWEMLQGRFDFESRRIQETSKDADELAAALALAHLKFMEECVEESNRLSRLLVPVVVLVRKELECPIDESEYGRMLEEQVGKLNVAVKDFSQQFHSQLFPKAQS